MNRTLLRTAIPVLGAVVVILAVAAVFATQTAAQAYVLDHFKCYRATEDHPETAPVGLDLEDQFHKETVSVAEIAFFCNPVQKAHAGVVFPIQRAEDHLTFHPISRAVPEPPRPLVVAANQFGTVTLQLGQATFLAVPTQKDTHSFPDSLDHYKCYPTSGPPVNAGVTLTDQFLVEQATVLHPVLFCNPVKKILPTGLTFPIRHPEHHLTCYILSTAAFTPRTVFAQNQFDTDTLSVGPRRFLCAPSQKTVVQPTLTPTPTAGVPTLTFTPTATKPPTFTSTVSPRFTRTPTPTPTKPPTTGQPNLVPTKLDAPTTGMPGQTVMIHYIAQNMGDGNAMGPWTDTLQLVDSAGMVKLTRRYFVPPDPQLPPGGTYERMDTFMLPPDPLQLPPGQYMWHLSLDAFNQVPESMEGDNFFDIDIFIAAPS